MSPKERVQIPREEAATALFAADRTCAKCRVPGRTIQIHHIDDDPSNNASSNLAILCLECHSETQTSGGFGRRLSAAEVTRYRDDWLARVRKRRDDADSLAAAAMSITGHTSDVGAVAEPWNTADATLPVPNRAGLAEYVRILPDLRRRAYLLMEQRGLATPPESAEGHLDLIAVLTGALVTLLSYYPAEHFSAASVDDYVSLVVAERTHWHYLRISSDGVGASGSRVQVRTAAAVVRDVERMIDETVATLTGADIRDPDDNELAWHQAWSQEVTIDKDGV
jgi:hypothetical protein